MSVHRNAALTLVKRRELVEGVAAGATLKAAAAAFNVGGNTVRRWWRRYQALGNAGLEDRSSRPKHMRGAISIDLRQEAVRLRRLRRTVRAIASELGISKTSAAPPRRPVRPRAAASGRGLKSRGGHGGVSATRCRGRVARSPRRLGAEDLRVADRESRSQLGRRTQGRMGVNVLTPRPAIGRP